MYFALPGMGADASMYAGPWRTLPDCQFLQWPAYRGEDSIAAVAARIIAREKIRAGDVVIGSSLGGIIACEIGNIIPLGGLVLVGGAKQKEEISSFLSFIHPLVDLAPLRFMQRLAGKVPNDVAKMFSKGDPEFIRAMCRVVFDWQGLASTTTNLLRIHGKRDHVIPVPLGVQHVVDGGHLIAITHAQECVDLIVASRCA